MLKFFENCSCCCVVPISVFVPMFVSMHPRLYTQIINENVNKSSQGIDIGIIFRKISLENNKIINFSDNFLYFS